MSNALAIAGVTAVLQHLLVDLQAALLHALDVNVEVSSLPPEHVPQQSNDGPRLNLFLYRVTQNAALRNALLPALDASGRQAAHPPLAVDLHYLLTAYGNESLHAEVLLGHAMQRMHENPVLTRSTIGAVLGSASTVPLYRGLQTTGLAEQVEMIKVTPIPLDLDELSKLWTALKANFRPSVAYQATVVLIESTKPAIAPLPVLSRGAVVVDAATGVPRETGIGVSVGLLPSLPEMLSIRAGSGQVAATPGDTLIVGGQHLDGVAGEYQLVLSNARLNLDVAIGPETSASPARVVFDLSGAPGLPAGPYTAALQLRKPADPQARRTNILPLMIAPSFGANPLPASVTPTSDASFILQPACVTQFRPEQRVSLILGDHEVVADAFSSPTTSPRFRFQGINPGTYWVRMRVDGVDSLLVDRSTTPASFNGPRVEVLP